MIKLKHSQNPEPRTHRGCFLALITLVALLATGAAAQTFTTLHAFTSGSDGASPGGGELILSGNTLYGTAGGGGTSGSGTVFEVNTDGTGFTTLHSFTATSASGSFPALTFTNSDGAHPTAGLILSGNTLYGTVPVGGTWGGGTVFKVNADGTGFTNLHTFTATSSPGSTGGTNNDGTNPNARLMLSADTLYGTAEYGGSWGNGTVFKINVDGTGFTALHSFSAASGSLPRYTNSDGVNPQAALILVGNTLYGTAPSGGASANGTVFAVNTDGTGFTILHTFTAGTTDPSGVYITNSDGAGPYDKLVSSGNTLYGAATDGGTSGNGTLFKLNTDGTGFTNLHTFSANSDGAYPHDLIVSGNTLYGTAEYGGTWGKGTVFKINVDGTGFTTLYSFTGDSDGASPQAGLILAGNTLYGTAQAGAISGNGTVFSLTLPQPLLTMSVSGTDVTLSWSTNYPGWVLQQSVNLGAAGFGQINLPEPPIIANGQFVVTLPITSSQQLFYRLSSQ